MTSSQPIGIFDSGVGGLSVLSHIHELMPTEDLLYVADSEHLPYGSKTSEYVVQRAIAITRFLVEQQGAKAIVIACNTATAAAVSLLRSEFPIPIIGMEPGVKPGIKESRSGVVAILATEGTLGSEKFQSLLEQHGNGAEVIVQPCNGWVEQVEHGEHDSPETRQMVANQIEPLLKRGADTLVLGCTHYPFLRETIGTYAGKETQVIDTGLAVAQELRRRLRSKNLLGMAKTGGNTQFWTSGPPEQTGRLISRLWGDPNRVNPLPV
ncbi:MAG: glutamate racemase [Gammaproteobacteria bacterium (ex Lamellibrachia satsuma)]|nr:MAG: glutamate racemase [Gammaproteobacteria bacterium (ex Lamellibrachia satsuma)]RRS33930.1 MAG: glutamate racemase [Gammaproteobacteria bacterium (ex Lamellibrachia satsuma)]RRS37504.1 MAG: glutamate racemase [Gammaproteobacteria bacterium (ex Lamellibrachia satsuma)]